MIEYDMTFGSPEENLIIDNFLLKQAEKTGQEYFRFWEASSVFVVLGRIGDPQQDIKIEAVKKEGVAVYRRCSGGGTVLQGPGCLNYTLVLDKERDPALSDIRKSYQYILAKVCDALRFSGIRCCTHPISDIALENGKKISGNAQKRGRKFILHHGTFLCDFQLSLIEKYLAMPKDMPDYRARRLHLDFVANLGLPSGDIKANLKKVFDCQKVNTFLSEEEMCLFKNMLVHQKVSVDI